MDERCSILLEDEVWQPLDMSPLSAVSTVDSFLERTIEFGR